MTILEHVSRKQHLLIHRLGEARMRYEALAITVGEAKNRIEMEPHVISVMEELQRREHERAVGAYEELLTLFLRDVLPGHRDVVMDLRTERGLPALDVYLRKGEDLPLEDALSGTGGSVTNILSAGLRFIALIRSGRRPFLVLDEPDCWIKPALAPKFAAVVQSVAEQLGVQVLMISHHDEQIYEAMLPHRVRVEKNDDLLTARWAPTSSLPEWQEDQPGLRSIELINFQSHSHTIMPLAPGLTLINGDNDIGKSAIVSALRDVFDASSNDQHIKHGAKSTKVILDFGPDKVLSWERFRKGAQKVIYELREAGTSSDLEALRKSVGARDVPEWVQEFGIGLIDGMDVQLANQKDPVFLLGETARERARALAIGGENAHVQEMLSLGKQDLSEARLTARNGEKQLETLHRFRQILEPMEARTAVLVDLEQEAARLEEDNRDSILLETTLSNWKKTKRKLLALSTLREAMPKAIETPEDETALRALVIRWHSSQRQAVALSPLSTPQTLPSMPEVDSSKIEDLVSRWRRAYSLGNILSPLKDVPPTQIPDIPDVPNGQLSSKWKTARARMGGLSGLLGSLPPELPEDRYDDFAGLHSTVNRWKISLQSKQNNQAEISQLEQDIIKQKTHMEAMGECPTCGRPKDHDHSLREDASP